MSLPAYTTANKPNGADGSGATTTPDGAATEAVLPAQPVGAMLATLPSVQDDDQLAQQKVKLARQEDGQIDLAKDARLINNLSPVVGFMELANAGDFAANVWNMIPVPIYAVVFMAIGGTVAGVLSIFAFRDARLAHYNLQYLRQQRKTLLAEQASRRDSAKSTGAIDVITDINFRELGSETVSRWLMDLFMGGGAILICVGTYMAIGGADPKVFLASNLLSGYIGNAPIALFGLGNSMWSAYIWAKAHNHAKSTRRLLGETCEATALVKRRCRRVQVYCVVLGWSTIMGGVGSMITATRWWGYVILIPVIIASIFCNIWWRKKIGYTRSEGQPPMNLSDLSAALEFAAKSAEAIKDVESSSPWLADAPNTLPDMLDFLTSHALFHRFCVRALADANIRAVVGADTVDELVVSPVDFLALPESFHVALVAVGQETIRQVDRKHFTNRARYLAELLGTFCALAPKEEVQGITEKE